MNCPICLLSNTNNVLNTYDDRYGYPGNYELVRCQNCYHVSVQCDFTLEQLVELYSKYYPRSSFDIENYKPKQKSTGFKAWLDGTGKSAFLYVPRNVSVLDIGCGFGESLGYHSARGCDIYGVEADENIRRIAEKFGYKVHVGLFDPELYDTSFFDYVTMDQVIEHSTDPLAILQDVYKVLKKGGFDIISTPNCNGWGAKIFSKRWINWHTPYHLQFYSKESMAIAAENAGFVIKKANTITSSHWLLYQWIHLMLLPDICDPSVFWKKDRPRKSWEAMLIKVCHIIHKTKINHLITRFFDSLGIGDNYLFILKKR